MQNLRVALLAACILSSGCKAPATKVPASTRPIASAMPTSYPATPDMRVNDAALRDAVLRLVLTNRQGSGLDFYGTEGSNQVVLIGEAAEAKLPEGWVRVEPTTDEKARRGQPRLLGITMNLSSYVLSDGVTRVVSVQVFNAGGSANGAVLGYTHIAYHATPDGAGWNVQLFMAMS